MLDEGWYLMSIGELESALRDLREGSPTTAAGVRLSIEEALAYRDSGNLPDSEGRTLRLVLRLEEEGVEAVALKRLLFEPDYHSAPDWRREGSKPINIVPLRGKRPADGSPGPWWEDPFVAPLEDEWQREGTVRGVKVPGDYRSFVYKTVLALEAAGQQVSATSIADSISRWVSPEDAERIRRALKDAQ